MTRTRFGIGALIACSLLAAPVSLSNPFVSGGGFVRLNEACAQSPIEEGKCVEKPDWWCIIGSTEKFNHCDDSACK